MECTLGSLAKSFRRRQYQGKTRWTVWLRCRRKKGHPILFISLPVRMAVIKGAGEATNAGKAPLFTARGNAYLHQMGIHVDVPPQTESKLLLACNPAIPFPART